MSQSVEAILIGGLNKISLSQLASVARQGRVAEIDPSALERIVDCHRFFQDKAASRMPIYGLNTQFGDQVTLLDKHLDDYESEEYGQSIRNRQLNLVRSHYCALGESVASEIVRGT